MDILVDKNDENVATKTYRKPTFTGLLTNFLSFTPMSYKKALLKTLLFRAYQINSSWTFIHEELKKIKEMLQKNSFPVSFIDDGIKLFLNNLRGSADVERVQNSENKINYFKLPYSGTYSNVVKKMINELVSRYCKNIEVKIIFTTEKLGKIFSVKDQLKSSHISNVVYKFECGSCNVSYIGETTRNFETRVFEHLETDKTSHVVKHIRSNLRCKDFANIDCFSIIDKGNNKSELKIKEGIWIKEQKPSFNGQIRCESINVLAKFYPA